MSFKYSDPLIYLLRSGDEETDPYVPLSIPYKIINSKVLLDELPVQFNRVQVDGYVEIPVDDESPLEENEFKANYTLGVLTFHPSAEGKTVNVQFFGRGVVLFPTTRIVRTDGSGEVVTTLEEIIQAGQGALDDLERVEQVITDAEDATDNANQAAAYATEQGDYAKDQGNIAKSKGETAEQQGLDTEQRGLIAEQQGNTAETQGDIAEQQGIDAETKGNTAMQQGNVAEQQGLVAEQQGNTAKQQGNDAEQKGNIAESQGNIAEQKGSEAETKGNVAEQQGNDAEQKGEVAQQKGLDAEQQGNIAEQQGIDAEQKGLDAQSKGNIAEQQGNTAESQGNIAEQQGNLAQQQGEDAEIKGNIAEQQGNVAEQKGNIAETQGLQAESHGEYALQQGNYAKSQGEALVFKGDYNNETLYVPQNMVVYSGSMYICIAETQGNLPTSPLHWRKVVEKGADGGTFVYKGEYSPLIEYEPDNLVTYSGNVYVCIQESLGNDPSDDAYWNVFLSKSIIDIKREHFTATEGQKVFSLLDGSYTVGSNTISVYVFGVKQPNSSFVETSSTQIELVSGVPAGTAVMVEYWGFVNVDLLASETARQEAESIRQSQELVRESQEQIRQLNTATAIADIEAVAITANSRLDNLQSDLNDFKNTKGQPDGIASLSSQGYVPASQLNPNIKENRVVSNIAERDALNAYEGLRAHVKDATADSTVDEGWAEYLYDGTGWTKTAERESMDIVLDWGNVEGRPSSSVIDIDSAVTHSKITTGNPHGTTKSDLQLGNVENKSSATIRSEITSSNVTSALGFTPATSNHTHPELHTHTNKSILDKITQTGTEVTFDLSHFATYDDIQNFGGGDMLKSIYDTNNNGKVDVAELAESVAWGDVTGKPSTFTPSSHSHTIENVTGLQGALDLKVDKTQVLTNVPANAKFTDTVYTHPASHPASMITESSSRRFVTDAEKSNWNSKLNQVFHFGTTAPPNTNLLWVVKGT